MEPLNRNDLGSNNNRRKSHLEEASSDLYKEGKKFAHELYEEGVNKVNEAEKNLKEYSDELLVKIKENPMSSVLIAAGIGFLLSLFMKK